MKELSNEIIAALKKGGVKRVRQIAGVPEDGAVEFEISGTRFWFGMIPQFTEGHLLVTRIYVDYQVHEQKAKVDAVSGIMSVDGTFDDWKTSSIGCLYQKVDMGKSAVMVSMVIGDRESLLAMVRDWETMKSNIDYLRIFAETLVRVDEAGGNEISRVQMEIKEKVKSPSDESRDQGKSHKG